MVLKLDTKLSTHGASSAVRPQNPPSGNRRTVAKGQLVAVESGNVSPEAQIGPRTDGSFTQHSFNGGLIERDDRGMAIRSNEADRKFDTDRAVALMVEKLRTTERRTAGSQSIEKACSGKESLDLIVHTDGARPRVDLAFTIKSDD